jgi:hypothetical protein
MAVIAGAVATGLAAASYELLEMPIRRSHRLDGVRWATVATGVAVAAVVAVAVVPPVLHSTRRPQLVAAAGSSPGLREPQPLPVSRNGSHRKPHATTQAARGRAKVPNGLDWAALASDNGPGRTCSADAPQKCTVVRGSGPHILLVGDSHGRMLAPALIKLAHEHDLTLSINTVSSCPWQAKLTLLHDSPDAQAACTAARDTWYRDVLPKLHPDLVILAEYSRDDEAIYGQTLRRTGGSDETLRQVVMNTTFETLQRITAAGSRALIMHNIITSTFDPLDCHAQATYLDQCTVPVPLTRPISDSFFDTAAVRMPGVFTFDVNPIACPGAPLCAPMIDGINVWRNVNHYSTQILSHFRAKVWSAITASGALPGVA